MGLFIPPETPSVKFRLQSPWLRRLKPSKLEAVHARDSDALGRCIEELEEHGFDLSAQGDPRRLPADLQQAIQSVFPGWGGGAPASQRVLLTGNTRRLWPLLQRAAPNLPATDPLDAYTERVHRAAVERWLPGAKLWFAHQLTPALPFPRLGEALGLCHVGPAHLAVHPTHGPWFGLRALVSFPQGNNLREPEAPSSARGSHLPPSPCSKCPAPCVPLFQQALAESRGEPTGRDLVARHFDAWLAVRDACPVGRESRYSEEQIRFHYGVASLPHV
ncbi:MAG: hypothetical protein H6718_15060 [Polyangiaceae bacterium]|nr:hypothetical protein [Polyangiaceae bacterium]